MYGTMYRTTSWTIFNFIKYEQSQQWRATRPHCRTPLKTNMFTTTMWICVPNMDHMETQSHCSCNWQNFSTGSQQSAADRARPNKAADWQTATSASSTSTRLPASCCCTAGGRRPTQTNYCKEKKIRLGTKWRGIARPVVRTLAVLLLELKPGLLGALWMVVIRDRSCHCDYILHSGWCSE